MTLTHKTTIDAKEFRARDVIFYDASCGICAAGTRRFQRMVGGKKFAFEPLQSRRAQNILRLKPDEIPAEMKLLTPDGRIFGGVDALLRIAGQLWWVAPMVLLAKIGWIRRAFDAIYKTVATNRHQISRACRLSLDTKPPLFCRRISVDTEITDNKNLTHIAREILFAVTPLTIVLFVGRTWPAWNFMWAIAAAMWIGAKLIAWRFHPTIPQKSFANAIRFFAWPGTDPRPFLRKQTVSDPICRNFAFAIAKIVIGLLMLALVTTIVKPAPLFAGWIACIGIVLALHFGIFELIAFAWRRRGVAVEPIMNFPIRAKSVGDFWRRWNLAFSDFVHPFVFKPILRRFGIVSATIATFLFSGVLHDLVISLPARGGYGRPTAYFMIQCLGLLVEKIPAYRKLPAGVKIWTARAIIALPLPLLVPAIFLQNVIVPTLTTLGGAL